MHPFVASVLLGLPGLDAFDGDTESEPPNGELTESKEGIGGGERDSVVAPDGVWESSLLEETLEGGEGGSLPHGFQRFTQKQVATGGVGHGEGVAVLLVSEFELSLEIHTPEVVGMFSG